jgi:hypothetical protein
MTNMTEDGVTIDNRILKYESGSFHGDLALKNVTEAAVKVTLPGVLTADFGTLAKAGAVIESSGIALGSGMKIRGYEIVSEGIATGNNVKTVTGLTTSFVGNVIELASEGMGALKARSRGLEYNRLANPNVQVFGKTAQIVYQGLMPTSLSGQEMGTWVGAKARSLVGYAALLGYGYAAMQAGPGHIPVTEMALAYGADKALAGAVMTADFAAVALPEMKKKVVEIKNKVVNKIDAHYQKEATKRNKYITEELPAIETSDPLEGNEEMAEKWRAYNAEKGKREAEAKIRKDKEDAEALDRHTRFNETLQAGSLAEERRTGQVEFSTIGNIVDPEMQQREEDLNAKLKAQAEELAQARREESEALKQKAKNILFTKTTNNFSTSDLDEGVQKAQGAFDRFKGWLGKITGRQEVKPVGLLTSSQIVGTSPIQPESSAEPVVQTQIEGQKATTEQYANLMSEILRDKLLNDSDAREMATYYRRRGEVPDFLLKKANEARNKKFADLAGTMPSAAIDSNPPEVPLNPRGLIPSEIRNTSNQSTLPQTENADPYVQNTSQSDKVSQIAINTSWSEKPQPVQAENRGVTPEEWTRLHQSALIKLTDAELDILEDSYKKARSVPIDLFNKTQKI